MSAQPDDLMALADATAEVNPDAPIPYLPVDCLSCGDTGAIQVRTWWGADRSGATTVSCPSCTTYRGGS